MARIAVIGPGALGTLAAVRLSRHHEVTLGCRDEARAALLAQHGILETPSRRGPTRRPRPAGGIEMAVSPDGAYDAIIVATKCQAAAEALRAWAPALRDGGVIIPFQNGLPPPEIKTLRDTAVACAVGFPASLAGPGQAKQTGPGQIVVGHWPNGTPSPQAQSAIQLMRPGFDAVAHDDMQGIKWGKLLVNAGASGLGTISGYGTGRLFASRAGRRAFLAVGAEIAATAEAAGIQLRSVTGTDPARIIRLRSASIQHALLYFGSRRYKDMRPSSLQFVERGEPSEIPYLNGAVVKHAATHGVEAPVNEAVVALAAEIDAGRGRPDPENLQRLPINS